MGQTCCSTDKPESMQQTAPDIIAKQPQRRPKRIPSQDDMNSESEDTDCDYDLNGMNGMNSNLDPSGPDIDYSGSLTPRPIHTEESKEKAISGFKAAVQSGNDSLAMHFVQEYPELDLLQISFEDDDNCLQIAVRNSSYNLIYYLLTNGVSPNEQNKKGETALHTAVRERNVRVVSLLSKYCADAQIMNKQYETPITIASENRDQDIIELLAPDTQTAIRQRIVSVYNDDNDTRNNAMIPVETMHFQNSSGIHDVADDILSDDSLDIDIPKNYELDVHNDNNTVEYAHINQDSDNGAFDDKLNVSEKLKFDAVRVSRINPFGKLKRDNTKKALNEMQQIVDSRDKLPTLAAWLEKKQSSMPYQWQKRWVVVKGSHFLWSDKQRNINDAKNIKERKKFNNSINIMSITEVKAVTKGKTQKKFIMNVGSGGVKNKRNEYIWKCATREDRNYWVNGLKKHIAHQKSVVAYLGTK